MASCATASDSPNREDAQLIGRSSESREYIDSSAYRSTTPETERERLLQAAFKKQGIPYEWGAKGPATYDCSGFTRAAYAAINVQLPDGSFNQAEGELPLKLADLTEGDLIFYRWSGSDRITHVTMYAGNGWIMGTGSPGQPKKVVLYPLTDDLVDDGRVITYRHIRLKDE